MKSLKKILISVVGIGNFSFFVNLDWLFVDSLKDFL